MVANVLDLQFRGYTYSWQTMLVLALVLGAAVADTVESTQKIQAKSSAEGKSKTAIKPSKSQIVSQITSHLSPRLNAYEKSLASSIAKAIPEHEYEIVATALNLQKQRRSALGQPANGFIAKTSESASIKGIPRHSGLFLRQHVDALENEGSSYHASSYDTKAEDFLFIDLPPERSVALNPHLVSDCASTLTHELVHAADHLSEFDAVVKGIEDYSEDAEEIAKVLKASGPVHDSTTYQNRERIIKKYSQFKDRQLRRVQEILHDYADGGNPGHEKNTYYAKIGLEWAKNYDYARSSIINFLSPTEVFALEEFEQFVKETGVERIKKDGLNDGTVNTMFRMGLRYSQMMVRMFKDIESRKGLESKEVITYLNQIPPALREAIDPEMNKFILQEKAAIVEAATKKLATAAGDGKISLLAANLEDAKPRLKKTGEVSVRDYKALGEAATKDGQDL